MRTTYWSCTKFANIIRGMDKIHMGTCEEWDKWENDAKSLHPFRYWIAEEVLDFIQDIVLYIPDKINDIRCYIFNRYVAKTHAMTSNLPRGRCYELDTRILHSLFDELVNFVEIEKAHMEIMANPSEYTKKSKRNPEAGLNYLKWESTILNTFVDKDDPLYNTQTAQANVAEWILNAYIWWKEIRPTRPDPMDVSGWSDFCDLNNSVLGMDPEKTKPMLDMMHELESKYDDEDEIMLMQLIKYRKYLWT